MSWKDGDGEIHKNNECHREFPTMSMVNKEIEYRGMLMANHKGLREDSPINLRGK